MTARVKPWLIAQVPLRHRTPLRYWYRALTGRLDRELRLLRRLIRPGAGVLDVGANAGLYTYAFGRTMRVDAFEPLPEPARTLRALATGLPDVRVHEVALSRQSGTATLYVPYLNGRPHSELASFTPTEARHDCVTVPVRRLDDYALSDIGLLKIDVEGHEQTVLEGASDTIARERPVLMIEIEQRHSASDIAGTFAVVAALGYTGHFIDPAVGLQPISAFRYAQHQAPYIERPTDARYVNNFVFVHASDSRSATALGRATH